MLAAALQTFAILALVGDPGAGEFKLDPFAPGMGIERFLDAGEPEPLDPAQGRPPKSPPFIDFAKAEAAAFVGVVVFSGDYEADPDYSAGALFRVPMPALPLGKWGVFAQAWISHIDRDIEDFRENPDGNFFCGAVGFDFEFVRNRSILLAAQAGAVYAAYGEVNGVDDGWGALLGGVFGVRFPHGDSKTFLTVMPQFAFDGGDWMFFAHVGLQFSF